MSSRKEKYALESVPLGRGGQAEVFPARDKRNGNMVALKKLIDKHNEDAVARMRREIEVQISLAHPNVMPIFDYSTSYIWYTMPIASQVLGKLQPPIDGNLLFDIVNDCAQGLLTSHSRGFIHRDLTPNNIFLLSDGNGERWVVSDWGLVRKQGNTTVVRTLPGQEFGTAGFAAPELWEDAHNADGRADVYSLGRVVSWCLTGRWPVPNIPLIPDGIWREFVELTTNLAPDKRIQDMKGVIGYIEKMHGINQKSSNDLEDVRLGGPNQHIEVPYQIALDRISEVRAKDLSSLYLDGIGLSKLPEGLFSLEDIDDLDISRNKLKSIPIELGQLISLKSLHLDSNMLSEIPVQLFQLVHLTRLYLNDNNISTLPTEISRLVNLEMLHLSNNPFLTLTPALGDLNRLTHLYLNSNQLTSLPPTISHLKDLTQLYLYDNELLALPEQIGELNNLTWLGIAGNRIDLIPSWIGNLKNLETLVLGTSNYHKVAISTLPPEIAHLKNLKRLDLANLHLTNLPIEMTELVNLQSLNLDGNPGLNIRQRVLAEVHKPSIILDYYFKHR